MANSVCKYEWQYCLSKRKQNIEGSASEQLEPLLINVPPWIGSRQLAYQASCCRNPITEIPQGFQRKSRLLAQAIAYLLKCMLQSSGNVLTSRRSWWRRSTLGGLGVVVGGGRRTRAQGESRGWSGIDGCLHHIRWLSISIVQTSTTTTHCLELMILVPLLGWDHRVRKSHYPVYMRGIVLDHCQVMKPNPPSVLDNVVVIFPSSEVWRDDWFPRQDMSMEYYELRLSILLCPTSRLGMDWWCGWLRAPSLVNRSLLSGCCSDGVPVDRAIINRDRELWSKRSDRSVDLAVFAGAFVDSSFCGALDHSPTSSFGLCQLAIALGWWWCWC